MAWLTPPVRVAAELAPAVWTFVAAEARRGAAPRLVAARAIGATGAALADDIRAFRRLAKLPMRVDVVLWPRAGDDGVSPIESRDAGHVDLPKAKVIRERVAPLVRAGGLVAGIHLPHECVGALVALRRLTRACVVFAHAGMTCVTVANDGVVRARYLSSTAPPATFESESARFIARYQHIAMLAPHIRDMGGAAPDMRLLVSGHLPALRAAMVPLVEELDHEIDVLDGDIPSPLPHALETADPDEIAGAQLAWALATTLPAGRAGR